MMTSHTRTPVPPNTYKQISVNDTTIHYLETGSASPNTPTLILSHAHLSDLRSFAALQSLLGPSFHIINYSRRFSWPNDPITLGSHDSWHQHASDLAELITTLTTTPLILEEPPLPYVFLPSLPPTPWMVLKFLFTHPTAFLPNLLFGINVIGPVTKHCKATPPETWEALEIFAPGVGSVATWDKIRTSPDQSRMTQVLDNVDVMVSLFRYEDTPVIGPEELAKVRCPVLMVTGRETIAAQKCIDWKAVMCLGSTVKREVLIEGAGHLVHEDQVERVVEEVKSWVGEVEGMKK